MTGLIREELLTTVKKKKFIVLAVLVFIGAIVTTVITRNKHWNDLTYYFAIQKYISRVFTPAIGITLILSVYRRKYTRESILQTENHHAGRSAGVLSRFISGSVILIACYAIMAVLSVVLGLVFGAHNTGDQIIEILFRLLTDCTGCIAAYAAALFWLYLFAFPAVAVVIFAVTMFILPYAFEYYRFYDNFIYQICGLIFPKLTGDIAFTDLVYTCPRIESVGLFIVQIMIPVLLAMLVFKLKKLKPAKDGKKPSDAAGEGIS